MQRKWYLQQFAEGNTFETPLLFTDDAIFAREGDLNKYNAHFWALANTLGTCCSKAFSIIVRASTLGNYVIGPNILTWNFWMHHMLYFR